MERHHWSCVRANRKKYWSLKMKCNGCNIKVGQEFAFAIRSNQCPGCGAQLMPADKLASYMGLQQLLKNNFPNMEVEKVTNLVIANFEIKQLFKEDGTQESIVTQVEEDIDSDAAYDAAYKKKQAAEAREFIEKERADVYSESVRAQYGMGDEDEENNIFDGDFDGDVNPSENVIRMATDAKQAKGHDGMISGAGGFSRSG